MVSTAYINIMQSPLSDTSDTFDTFFYIHEKFRNFFNINFKFCKSGDYVSDMSDVSNVSGCSIGSFSQVARSDRFSKIAVLKNKTLPSKIASSIMFTSH